MSPGGETKKKRVLVVDDDLPILDVIRTILEENGFIVDLAEDSGDLKRLLKRHRLDLILLDIWLSDRSGQEIAQELKGKTGTQAIPIIMISAHNVGEKIADESGVDAFLAKPFDIDDLLSLVNKYTAHSKN